MNSSKVRRCQEHNRGTNQGRHEPKHKRTENPREDDHVGAVAHPSMRLQGQKREEEMGAMNKSETKEKSQADREGKGQIKIEETATKR